MPSLLSIGFATVVVFLACASILPTWFYLDSLEALHANHANILASKDEDLADMVASKDAALADMVALEAALADMVASKDAALADMVASKDAALADMAAKDAALAAKDAALAAKDAALAATDVDLADPYLAKGVALEAFEAADVWRRKKTREVYARVTKTELRLATRWKHYAQPFALLRTCNDSVYSSGLLSEISGLGRNLSRETVWNSRSSHMFLSIHTFHSTGIEGSTLTLSETTEVVGGKSLYAGFPEDFFGAVTATSNQEVQNQATAWSVLRLGNFPVVKSPIDISNITTATLIELNQLLVRGTGVRSGLRVENVGVGHTLSILPKHQELPTLVDEYVVWLNRALQPPSTDKSLAKVLSLACDAHTRLVHIHPFEDGNGRLARTMSALVLQRAGIVPALFSRHRRTEYMKAVSSATIDGRYEDICLLHAQGVKKSLDCLRSFLKGSYVC
jgi:Fic family protein